MKKIISLIIILFTSFSIIAENNPVADPNAIIISGDMRFTVLTPEMIRIEWSGNQIFEDRASFAVINRRLTVPAFTKEEKDGFLYIKTEKLTLQYRIGSFPGTFNPPSSQNLKITFPLDGRVVTWYPWKTDNLNLKGTTRTLDSSNGDNKLSEMENGLISRSGWAVIDETHERQDGSKSLMFEPRPGGIDWVAERADKTAMDWYFMGYGHDYKKALSDFTKIAGKIPMPPMYAFGYWYSKYSEYSEQDFKDLVGEIKQNDIPIDVMVVDMDWHYSGSSADGGRGGWTGWTWNARLFPNPPEFLQWLHNNNLKSTLNLHPADGVATDENNFSTLANDLNLPLDKTIPWHIESENFYKMFFKNIIRPHENIGVDFWWLDWQQTLLSSEIDKLGNTFWLNHVFYNDNKLQDKGRAMIFHRWGGLGNHRYQIGFSGDTYANFPTLAFQPYFTATASNVGYGYWSHDIGGHVQIRDNNPELFLRWIQYGVFSPILRTHSTKNAAIERRIWKYSNFPLMKEALELRYALVPYIYTQSRITYDTGISICRPLYYDSPDNSEAYKHGDEYMFGNDILAAPIVEAADASGVSTKSIWFPEGKWYEVCSGEILEGNKTYTRTFSQADIPYYYKEGAIIPCFPKLPHLKNRPNNLILKFAPGASGEMNYYEDENDNNNYETSNYAFTKITQSVSGLNGIYTIYPVQGSFAGMLTTRSYTMELLSVNLPTEVKINETVYTKSESGDVGTWKYDNAKKIATIYIPLVPCNEKTEVKVVFSDNQTAITLPDAGKKAYLNYHRDTKELNVYFNAFCESVLVNITDISGKKILTKCFENSQNISLLIPFNQVSGVYIVSLNYDGKKQIEKLIL